MQTDLLPSEQQTQVTDVDVAGSWVPGGYGENYLHSPPGSTDISGDRAAFSGNGLPAAQGQGSSKLLLYHLSSCACPASPG